MKGPRAGQHQSSGLTRAQRRMWDGAVRLFKENGACPEVGQLADALGISQRAVHLHLAALVKKGWATRVARKGRPVTVKPLAKPRQRLLRRPKNALGPDGPATPAGIEINPEFGRALERMYSGKGHLFITGKAGTGKSTLLEYFRAHAEQEPVVLAPTGVAALNVGGQTIHRFFQFGTDVTPQKLRESRKRPRNAGLYRNLRTIIIDEVSMVRADLLDCIDLFLQKHGPKRRQPFGGVQMIFVGDLYQLPPVVGSGEREIFRTLYETPYFFSANALGNAELEIIELKKIYRQKDARFVEILNHVRNDTVDEADIDALNARLDASYMPASDEFCITLTTTNRNADAINDRTLASLPGEALVSVAEIEGDFGREYHPTSVELAIKPGAQIMLLNNDAKRRWVNGSIGTIESIRQPDGGDPSVMARLKDEEALVQVEPHAWELIRFALQDGQIATERIGRFRQLPLRLAWAVTIHKSQGKTFDNIVVDLERGAFAAGQTYVALSRCTSLEGIVLKRPISEKSIRADWRVCRFFTTHWWRESERNMPLEKKLDVIENAIARRLSIEMTYLKPDDTRSIRTIRPLSVGTESYRGRAFLGMRAYCLLRQDERMFRVDRILSLAAVDRSRQ